MTSSDELWCPEHDWILQFDKLLEKSPRKFQRRPSKAALNVKTTEPESFTFGQGENDFFARISVADPTKLSNLRRASMQRYYSRN